MEIRVNGKSESFEQTNLTIVTLLNHYNLEKKSIIVELNEQIINKEDYDRTHLSNGDRVEIIHFVGGG